MLQVIMTLGLMDVIVASCKNAGGRELLTFDSRCRCRCRCWEWSGGGIVGQCQVGVVDGAVVHAGARESGAVVVNSERCR